MEQLPGNSHRSQQKVSDAPAKAEPKKIEKVVKGEVVTRKKPFFRRMADSFMVNRADVVGEVVFWDVLVPAAKNTIADAATSFVNRMMFGDNSPRGRAPSIVGQVINQSVGAYGHAQQQQYAYNRVGNPIPGAPVISRVGRARHDFKEIIIPTRVEADELVAQLLWHIEQYNAVTVADFYQMCGITPDYTDDKFGWTDIRGTGVLLVRDGFILDLPRPIELV